MCVLAGFGFTHRQGEFLVTVMFHSGCCLERQYCAPTGSVRGQNSPELASVSVLAGSVGADRLTEVPSRELAARAGLQKIPLELERGRLLVELDHDQRAPRSMFAGVS